MEKNETPEKPKRNRRTLIIILAVVLVACCGLAGLGTMLTSNDDVEETPEIVAEVEEQQTPVTPDPTRTLKPTNTPGPTSTPKPTNTPEPTDTPDPWDSVEIIPPGTYLVDTDISPGIYMGFSQGCYWERLSGLSGEFGDIIANGNTDGRFYVEVLPGDAALSVDCELAPLVDLIETFPTLETMQTLEEGMYLVGRDIEPGTYRGEQSNCYWERLSGVSGSFNDIIANDNTNGQFFIEVKPTDFALNVGCPVNKN